ncbi:MAG TPA: hypothetical protein VFP59_12430 [Candidatus Angelobacter sp.]|nr:hypothetical protein [Candidatus Angelobacter sp.]
MGRQIQFHMLGSDCKEFVQFIQNRDPVIVIQWISESQEIEETKDACAKGGWYCLWNQQILLSLKRTYIRESDRGPYYRVDSALPVIEFSYTPTEQLWNRRAALIQGRLWAGFENESKEFAKWYGALVRWIQRNFIKNPVPLLGGYLGPAAYNWYLKGGLLLPGFQPPTTAQWLSWAAAQDAHRVTAPRNPC